jgi:outer membrane protein TolC
MTTRRSLHARPTRFGRVALAALALALAGCVSYRPLPLAKRPHWITQPLDAAGKPLRQLDMTQAAQRALCDNADYHAALQDAHLSALQLRAAGLLPEPQFGVSVDHPTTPGNSRQYGLSLSEDLSWLLTRSARIDAARAERLATHLRLAWQGWMLSQRTASDYVDTWMQQRICQLWQQQVARLQKRQHAYDAALARGDVTLGASAVNLTALSNAQAQLHQAREARRQARERLNRDLRLAPGVQVHLAPPARPAWPDPASVHRAIAALPRTRPDLLALRAGYRAADARFRASVMAQFPGLSVGVNRARDFSNVHSTGLSISLTLPVTGLARNAAQQARASRRQLHDLYSARLEQASAQALTLDRSLRGARHRLAALKAQLPRLHELARRTDRAFAAGHVSGAAWLGVHQNLLARELEALDLRATLARGRIALAALLGHPPVPAAPAPTSSRS